MKKIVTVAAILSVIGFASYQAASAHGGRYFGNNNYGPGYCGTYNSETPGYTEEDQAALEKFRDETTAIRKEIVVKRSELNALLGKDNPNETKVAKLTGELYDLKAELDSKAEAAGIDERFAYGHGPGMMRGYGWGHHGYMMDW
jgi:Spy/CpxP family protein refolding chaperone